MDWEAMASDHPSFRHPGLDPGSIRAALVLRAQHEWIPAFAGMTGKGGLRTIF
jgi:hypothetical protein